jgi:hypothetical protein
LIVISDLIQMGHPGYRLMKSNRVITESQLPVFLDYVSLVYERFKFYVNEESYGNLEYGSHLMEVINSLKVLAESDDPAEVIPVRETLRNTLEDFEQECKRMGTCFTNPPFVKEFYNDLADKVINSAQAMMGTNGIMEGME